MPKADEIVETRNAPWRDAYETWLGEPESAEETAIGHEDGGAMHFLAGWNARAQQPEPRALLTALKGALRLYETTKRSADNQRAFIDVRDLEAFTADAREAIAKAEGRS